MLEKNKIRMDAENGGRFKDEKMGSNLKRLFNCCENNRPDVFTN